MTTIEPEIQAASLHGEGVYRIKLFAVTQR